MSEPDGGGQESYFHRHGGTSHEVITSGPVSGRPVILLHEMDGYRSSFSQLAERLGGAGFRIHAPVFYDLSSLPELPAAAVGFARICISREFHAFTTRGNSRVAQWVRSLASAIAGEGSRVGVVGMCMTGGLALAAVADSSVAAAVAAQPAMPFANGPWPLGSVKRRLSLGLSNDEEQAVLASDTPVLALRFARDPMSPRERVERIDDLEQGCALWLRTEDDPNLAGHATLTAAFRKGEPDVREASLGAIDQVVTFLDQAL